MSIWAIVASPLWIGGDVRTINGEYKAILQNKKILAVSQDGLKSKGGCVEGCGGNYGENPKDIQVWAREITAGDAVTFVNLGDTMLEGVTSSTNFLIPEGETLVECVDLWANDDKNLCPKDGDNISENWIIAGERSTFVKITALNVPATGQRSIRFRLAKQQSEVKAGSLDTTETIFV